jgi:hypothetical protein
VSILAAALSPLCKKLQTIDPNEEVDTLVVDGATLTTTNFVNLDEARGLATFLTDTGVTLVDCRELSAVNFVN